MVRNVVTRAGPTTTVVLVYASTTVVWTSYALIAVALPFRFQALGLSVVQYGIALGVFAFGMLLTESFWGVLAFRIGSLRTILALGAVVMALFAAIDLSTSFITLTVVLGLFGAIVVFPVPLFRWMAMIAGGPGTEGSGTGRYGVFFGGGMVAGSALGPLLYVALGFGGLTVVVLSVYAGGLALMGVLPWKETQLPIVERGSFSLVRRVLTSPFLFAAGLVVVAYVALSLIVNFLQIYSVSSFNGTPAAAGYVIGLARATLLFAGFALGGTVDRWRPIRTVPFGFLLIALGAFATIFSASYAEMVGSTLVLATGIGWLTAGLLPLALETVPTRLQGTAVGVFGSFEDLGLLVGPVAISLAYANVGSWSIFVLVGALALVASLLSVLFRRIGRTPTLRSLGSGLVLVETVQPEKPR